jgi:adenylate cyclase
MTFRTTITVAVMAFITALAACLILIQAVTFHAAARDAASAYMDATSANALSRLGARVSELSSLIRVLSKNPFLTDSDDRSEVDGAAELFKTALDELPQSDSLYVGYDNGCWLQARRLENLDPAQRQRLGAPADAVYNINLVRPTPGGALPMRRIFEDERGRKIEQFDLWDYGYDARQRSWYPADSGGSHPRCHRRPHGRRAFELDPEGCLLFATGIVLGRLASYRINGETGALTLLITSPPKRLIERSTMS